jgi:transposase
MTIYIGLDVHSKMTVYVAQNSEGKTIARGEVPTTPAGVDELLKRTAAPAATPIALESGTQATWLARLLEARAMAPVVIAAQEVRAKARNPRQKSDRRDAFEICDGLRRNQWVSRVWVPAVAIEQMRAILSRRRHFVGLATRQTNAAKFLLRWRGQSRLYRSLATEAAWDTLLAHPDLADLADHLKLHRGLWLAAKKAIARLERELAAAARPLEKELARLQTMPGVGPVVAASFVAALGNPERFANAAKVVGYLGLAVATDDSGERERHGHITKTGNSPLRALLCEAAHHAARPTHPLYPYYARIAARKGPKMAVVAIAQRLTRMLWQMWRQGQDFDPARLNVESVHKVRSRTIHWEIRQPPAA